MRIMTSSPIPIPTNGVSTSYGVGPFPSSMDSDSSTSPVGSPQENDFVSANEVSSDIETAQKITVLREIRELSKFIKANANQDYENLAFENKRALRISEAILTDEVILKITDKDVKSLSPEEMKAVPEKLKEAVRKMEEIKLLKIVGKDELTVPATIKHLTGLTNFGLNSNDLRSLPDEMGKLVLMIELNLCGNAKLTSLPLSLSRLPNLKRIFIENTGIQRLQGAFHGKIDPAAPITEWIA